MDAGSKVVARTMLIGVHGDAITHSARDSLDVAERSATGAEVEA